jgi:hypothetical protein
VLYLKRKIDIEVREPKYNMSQNQEMEFQIDPEIQKNLENLLKRVEERLAKIYFPKNKFSPSNDFLFF